MGTTPPVRGPSVPKRTAPPPGIFLKDGQKDGNESVQSHILPTALNPQDGSCSARDDLRTHLSRSKYEWPSQYSQDVATSRILFPMAQSNARLQDQIAPSLETVKEVLAKQQGPKKPNLVPLYGQISSDLITPSAAYLKVVAHTKSPYSVLFESAASERVGRYSFVGAGPRKIIKTGEGHGESCDPIPALEEELSQYVVADVPDLRLPPLTGGAIGYIGYDCVR